jgi:hypothetical protein
MSSTSLPDLKLTGRWHIERDEDAGVVWIHSSAPAPAPAPAPEPADWRARMVAALRTLHDTAVVGAKRLTEEGRLFSMGEFIVHPKGFHHVGQGVLPQAYRFPEEVDAVAGGVLCVDGDAYDQVDGDTLVEGDLGLLELCLSLRRIGRRCIVVPQVAVTDTFTPAPDDDANAALRRRSGRPPGLSRSDVQPGHAAGCDRTFAQPRSGFA